MTGRSPTSLPDPRLASPDDVGGPGDIFEGVPQGAMGLPGFNRDRFAAAIGHPPGTFESNNAVRLLAVEMHKAGAGIADCPFDPGQLPVQHKRWTDLVRRMANGPGFSPPVPRRSGSRPSGPVMAPTGAVDPRSLDGYQGDPLDMEGL